MIVSRKLLLPSLLILFIGVTLVHPQITIGQTNTNFLTYTNPELGFIIEYPSDWKIAEQIYPDMVNINSTSWPPGFTAAIHVDHSELRSLAELEKLMVSGMKNESQTYPDFRLVEVNNDTYYLGGHPALRIITIFTPENETQAVRLVDYKTLIDGEQYSVAGGANATLFPEYETTFQHMVESFRAIKLQ